tara:strand:- start:191 stop:604 length:414 start_codon:yes stop_codon:yes gene_type:complete
MKLDEILLIGGALVAALVLSKNGKLSSAYSLPQVTNSVTNIITKVKSEPIQKTTTLLENILPTPIAAPIAAPTPDPIILTPLESLTKKLLDTGIELGGSKSWSVNQGRYVYVNPDGTTAFKTDSRPSTLEQELLQSV